MAFSTIPFHLRWSWTCSAHFISFTFFKSFLTSSSHRDLSLPTGRDPKITVVKVFWQKKNHTTSHSEICVNDILERELISAGTVTGLQILFRETMNSERHVRLILITLFRPVTDKRLLWHTWLNNSTDVSWSFWWMGYELTASPNLNPCDYHLRGTLKIRCMQIIPIHCHKRKKVLRTIFCYSKTTPSAHAYKCFYVIYRPHSSKSSAIQRPIFA